MFENIIEFYQIIHVYIIQFVFVMKHNKLQTFENQGRDAKQKDVEESQEQKLLGQNAGQSMSESLALVPPAQDSTEGIHVDAGAVMYAAPSKGKTSQPGKESVGLKSIMNKETKSKSNKVNFTPAAEQDHAGQSISVMGDQIGIGSTLDGNGSKKQQGIYQAKGSPKLEMKEALQKQQRSLTPQHAGQSSPGAIGVSRSGTIGERGSHANPSASGKSNAQDNRFLKAMAATPDMENKTSEGRERFPSNAVNEAPAQSQSNKTPSEVPKTEEQKKQQPSSNQQRAEKGAKENQPKGDKQALTPDMLEWIKYRTQITYAQDTSTENQLTSLKEVLKKRAQFNKEAAKFIKEFEKKSIGKDERQKYKPKPVTIHSPDQLAKDKDPAQDQNEEGEEDKDKNLWQQFTMMYEDSVYKVRDENSFIVRGQHKRFAKNSLGIFDNKQKFRYGMVYMTTSKWFENCVIALIVFNSLLLGIKDYTDVNNTTRINSFIEDLEPMFTYMFLLECMSKIIAQGFIIGKNSYLSEAWNWLDFTVVVASFLQQFPSMKNMSGLRTFRLFRPLRSLTTMPSMRILIGTLLQSVVSLGGIMALALFFFMIYAILGVTTWNGKLHYRCYTTPWPELKKTDGDSAAALVWKIATDAHKRPDTRLCDPDCVRLPAPDKKLIVVTDRQRRHNQKEEQASTAVCSSSHNRLCPAGSYCNSRYVAFDAGYQLNANKLAEDTEIYALNYGITNFDNFFTALLTIFQCITMEGWTKIMNIYEDASNALFVSIYFISCVVICSFFLLNLTIAVMLMKYEELDKGQKKSEHNKQLKDIGQEIKLPHQLTEFLINQDSIQIQSGAIKMLKQEDSFIVQLLKPPKLVYEKNHSYYQKAIVKFCLKIIKNSYFDAFIILIIIANTFTLALDKYPAHPVWVLDTLSVFNLIFTAIFTAEVVLKIIAMGTRMYFKDNFNRFDFLIVVISLVELWLNSIEVAQCSEGKILQDKECIATTAARMLIGTSSEQQAQEQAQRDGPGFVSSFRGFRLLKIFKLFRSGDLKILVDSITFTLSTIGDYVILLSLFIYVFALLGMSFFAGRIKFNAADQYDEQNGEAPRTNFDGLFWAIITIFQVLMGQGWNDIMYQAMRTPTIGYYFSLYFVALVIFGNIIMLNLFLAILLGNFDKARIYGQKKKVFEAFKEIICEGKTLNEALDIILGDMSKHVKIKVLKWDPIMVNQLHDHGDSKIAQDLLMDGYHFFTMAESHHDNLTDNYKPMSHANMDSIPSVDNDDLSGAGDGSSRQRGGSEMTEEEIQKQKKVEALKTAFAAGIKAKVETRVQVDQDHKKLVEENKKNKKYAKTVELWHRKNAKIMRAREFNVQAKIEPWEGLEYLIKRESLPQTKVERRKSRLTIAQKRQSQNNSNMLKVDDDNSYQSRGNNLLSPKNMHIGTPDSKNRSEIAKSKELELVNAAKSSNEESQRSQMKTISVSSARKNESTKKHEGTKLERSNSMKKGEEPLPTAGSESNKSPAKKCFQYQNCSLFLFHKDWKLRRLFLILSESQETLDELNEFEKTGANSEHSSTEEEPAEQYGQQKSGKRHPSKIFEDFILVMILFSTILLAVDNPLYDPQSNHVKILNKIDHVFTLIFLIECLIKIIAKGFYYNHLGPVVPYIKNSWNVLDFLIVLSSVMDYGLALFDVNLEAMKSLKAFRALRGLRPLRMISRDEGMRLVVNALLASLPSMTNVLLICFLFILIFAIMGVSFFQGMFYHCVENTAAAAPAEGFELWVNNTVVTREDCIAGGQGIWKNQDANFDNVINAMLNLFQMMTTEGWVKVMYNGIDSSGIGKQPKKDADLSTIIFFLAFMIVGSQFIINLFVGVVIDNFNLIKEKEELGNMFVTEQQRSWIEIQKIGQSKKLRIKISEPQGIQGKFFRLVNDKYFEYTITFFIVFNTICMAMQSYRMDEDLEQFGENANYLFAFVFNVEMVFKLMGLHKIYFMYTWNLFDMFIVIATDASIIMTFTAADEAFGSTATVFRAFRIMRMFKLIRSSVHMRLILDTVFNILPQISNVMSLIFLLFFIYAALGLNLFCGVMDQQYLDDKNNFHTFPNSMVMLMKFSTGEDWNAFMYELANQDGYNSIKCKETETYKEIELAHGVKSGCGTVLSYPFFISFTVIVTMLIMNLSVAAVIEGLDTAKKENLGIIQGDEIEMLIDYWQDYDHEATGWITMTDLVFLLYELPPPLGKRSSRINSNLAEETKEASKKTLRQQDRYLVNYEKRIIMKKIDALDLLRDLRIRVYSDAVKQINFVDVFKALTKRIFVDNQIDYKLSPGLSKKINTQWGKKHKDGGKQHSQYTAREQQAGSIITKWAKKILSMRKTTYKLDTKKVKLSKKQLERQRALDQKNKMSRKEQLQKQANIIYNIINKIPNIDSIDKKEQDDKYKIRNEYEWKKNDGEKIMRHEPDSYSIDQDSSDLDSARKSEHLHLDLGLEKTDKKLKKNGTFEEFNTVQQSASKTVKPLDRLNSLLDKKDMPPAPTFNYISLDIFNLDDGTQNIESKEVFQYIPGKKPKKDFEATQARINHDIANVDKHPNLEDPRLMPNEKYTEKSDVQMHKTKLRQMKYREKLKQNADVEAQAQMPNFTRNEQTFICGGNNDTITIDERLTDPKKFKQLQKKKREAKEKMMSKESFTMKDGKKDKMKYNLTQMNLFLDDFANEEEDRLAVKRPPQEELGVFGRHIADPALPARARSKRLKLVGGLGGPRSATPDVEAQHTAWASSSLAAARPSREDLDQKLDAVDPKQSDMGRLLGLKTKELPAKKVTTNNFMDN